MGIRLHFIHIIYFFYKIESYILIFVICKSIQKIFFKQNSRIRYNFERSFA